MEDQANADFFNSLLVVLVSYKMKIEESPSYRSLTAALTSKRNSASLFIYDNSPQAQELTTEQYWNTVYRHDPSNPGVSKAYNEGFKKAKELNKKWLLLVDQDTVFPTNCFDCYYKCILELKQQVVVPILRDKIGIISPFKFYFGGGARLREVSNSALLNLNDYFFINSGLLIDVTVFETAGGYDEKLPLDFSDIAFVHRLSKRIDFFAVADIICQHSLATTVTSSTDDGLERFRSYMKSAKYFKSNYNHGNLMLGVRIFFKAMKLSFRYQTSRFIFDYLR